MNDLLKHKKILRLQNIFKPFCKLRKHLWYGFAGAAKWKRDQIFASSKLQIENLAFATLAKTKLELFRLKNDLFHRFFIRNRLKWSLFELQSEF